MMNELQSYLNSSHNEETIIVSVLQNPSIINQLKVKPFMISDTVNKEFFKAFYNILDKNLDLDLSTVINQVLNETNYDKGSLYERLKVYQNSELPTSNIEDNERTIVEKYKKRMQIKALQKAMETIAVSTTDNTYNSIVGNLDAINTNSDIFGKTSKRLVDIAVKVINDLDSDKPTFYKTGFRDLDKYISWQPGDLNVIGARPGQGKTAIGVQLGIKHAQENNQAVIFFSKEMYSEDIVKRILSSESMVQSRKFKNSELLDVKEYERLYSSLGVLDNTDFCIDDSSYMTPSYIKQKTREFAALNKDKHILVIIDYLQILDHEDKSANSYERVTKISTELKAIAKDLGVTVLALAQLNRGNQNRADSLPKASDLRDSGKIEQDASVILLLHRDHLSENLEERSITNIIIDKNRNGEPGTVKLKFIGELSKFINIG